MGRTRDAAIAQATERYAARIPHYMPFELRCLPDVKTSRATTEARQKEDEGKAFLTAVSPAISWCFSTNAGVSSDRAILPVLSSGNRRNCSVISFL